VETFTTERFEIAGEKRGGLQLVMSATGRAGRGTAGWVEDVSGFSAAGGGEWDLALGGALDVKGESWADQSASMDMGIQGIPLLSESVSKTDLAIRPL